MRLTKRRNFKKRLWLQFSQKKELELKQLQETIVELRSELDRYHGK